MKFFSKIPMFCFFFNFFLYAVDELSVLAKKYGTDKAPYSHNYTPIYHNYFKSLRNERIKFLEIGFLEVHPLVCGSNIFQRENCILLKLIKIL